MSDYVDISDAILDGTLDTVLDSLQEDINTRKGVLRAKRARRAEALSPGTRVRLVGVSPKKAEGATGELVEVDGKLGIVLDFTLNNRLRGGNTYHWPASCYEAIDNE